MSNSNPYCQIHKVEMVYKKGVSKAGKDYEGYFCPEKKEDGMNCDSVQWISNQKKYSPKQAINSPSKEEYANLMVANRELYLLMKVICFKLGLSERDIADDLSKLKEKNV